MRHKFVAHIRGADTEFFFDFGLSHFVMGSVDAVKMAKHIEFFFGKQSEIPAVFHGFMDHSDIIRLIGLFEGDFGNAVLHYIVHSDGIGVRSVPF